MEIFKLEISYLLLSAFICFLLNSRSKLLW